MKSWNELRAAYVAGEATEQDLKLFLIGAEVMNRSTYQVSVAADNEWRVMMLELATRQAQAIERIAAALEK